jgi:hypothetical protein
MKTKPTYLIDLDETKRWYNGSILHREDGPAVEYADGSKWWFDHGVIHREDGPAVEFADGTKRWWLNAVQFKEEDYWKELFNRGKITEKELFVKLL